MTEKSFFYLPHMAISFLVGAAFGVTLMGFGNEHNRKRIRKHAQQTMRSAGNVANDIMDIVKD